MRGIGIFQNQSYREISPMWGSLMRGLPVYINSKFSGNDGSNFAWCVKNPGESQFVLMNSQTDGQTPLHLDYLNSTLTRKR